MQQAVAIASAQAMPVAEFEAAKAAIKAAQNVVDVKDIRDKADALRQYARKRADSFELQQNAAEITLRCERRIGELLADSELNRGTRGQLVGPGVIGGTPGLPPINEAQKLSELGITKNQSSRAQAIASLSEEEFEQKIAETKEKGAELTLKSFWTTAKRAKQNEAREAAVIEQNKIAPIPAEIRQSDYKDFLLSFDGGSVDLLLTDPPYMTDIEGGDIYGFAKEWVPIALKTLRSSARAYICTGAYPKELQAYLQVFSEQGAFSLENVLVWTYRNTLGPSPKYNYKLNWQAVFYLKGPDAPPLDCPVMTEQFSVQDINAPDGRLGDRYHAWQKPSELGERFVRHSTKPKDLVLDPFACTGTFLLAAARLGRQAIGCDINPEHISIAEKRGCVRG